MKRSVPQTKYGSIYRDKEGTVNGGRKIVEGTPTWAVVAAYATVLSVTPSAVWRTAIGLGADLGMPQAWRDFEHVPGWGTLYVLSLSVLEVGAAGLTLGLVYPWGEVVPSWVPRIGGRRVPVLPAVVAAGTGAALVIVICATAALNWNVIIEYKGKPAPGWYELVTAAYLPALLWGPLLLTVTWAYWRRRTSRGSLRRTDSPSA